jgi:hypothetical protein
MGLLPLVCGDFGLESRRYHGCLSVVMFVLSGRDLRVRLITRPEES